MSTCATGMVETKSWEETTYAESDEGTMVTRASVSVSFHGDIEGEGTEEYLMFYPGDDSGSLLALSEGEYDDASLPRSIHFGFQRDSVESVLDAREEFQRAGIEELEFQDNGPVRVQVLDPDGYRVEVFAY